MLLNLRTFFIASMLGGCLFSCKPDSSSNSSYSKSVDVVPLDQQIDSLWNCIQSADSPGDKAGCQSELAELYLRSNSDSSLSLSKRVISSFLASADAKLKSSIVKSQVEYRFDSVLAAYTTLHLAESYLEEASDSNVIKSYALVRAFISELNLDYQDAVRYNQLGLQMSVSDTMYLARFEHNLGLSYKAIDDFHGAIPHLLRSAYLFESLAQPTYRSVSFLEVASLYSELEMWDSVLYYNQLGSVFLFEVNAHYELVTFFQNEAKVYEAIGDCNSAISSVELGLAHLDSASSQMPTVRKRCELLLSQGALFECMNQLPNAIHSYKQAVLFAEQQGLSDLMAQGHYSLSNGFLKMNNKDSAFYHLEAFLKNHDDALERNQTVLATREKAFFESQLAVEIEKLERQEQVSESRRVINILLLLVILAVVLLVVFIEAYRRKRIKTLELNLTKKSLELELTKKSSELLSNSIQLSEVKQRVRQAVETVETVSEDSKEDSLLSMVKVLKSDFGKASLSELDFQLKQGDPKLFEILSTKYPDLTRQDLRLCAFIKLNLSTKEISSITHQSENSLKVARYRLRKKLGLSKNENLTNCLNKLSVEK